MEGAMRIDIVCRPWGSSDLVKLQSGNMSGSGQCANQSLGKFHRITTEHNALERSSDGRLAKDRGALHVALMAG